MKKTRIKEEGIRVLVAIVTYNGANDIEKCVNSLSSKKYQVDVFIIDNNSTDNTISILKTYGKRIITVFSPKNLGFGQANNIAIKYCLEHNYDYIFLLNQDTYFLNSTLNQIIDIAIQNPQFAIYSPLHLAPNEKDLDTNFQNYYLKEQLKTVKIERTREVAFINAAAWLIPREVIAKIGGFSPIYFHYGEDRDYANRLLFYSGSFIVVSDSLLVHNRESRKLEDLIEINKNNYILRSKINLLRYLTNINDPLFIGILKMIFLGLGQIKKQVLQNKWKLGRGHLKNIILIFLQMKEIIEHRNRALDKNAFL